MLEDLVVDTNVLMHADDPRQPHQREAEDLLDALLTGTVKLCVDEGFSVIEAENRSLIGGEYLERLNPSSTGFYVLTHLSDTGRIRFLAALPPQAVKQVIQQCVRNKRDRTFLGVAHNSASKVLCSHDLQDMSAKKRKYLEGAADIEVLTCSETRARL